MSNLKLQVLKDIKKNGITPTSRFYFVTKNYFFWLMFVVSVVIGAIGFSSILFEMVVGSQYLSGLSIMERPSLFIQSIPVFWVLLLVLFAISACLNFKRTDGAHKQENAVIVLSSILFSLLLGLLLFKIGFSQNLDYMMKTHLAPYRAAVEKELERTVHYLQTHNADARAALLQREKLRTLCFNQGHDNCFVKIIVPQTSLNVQINQEVKENE